MTDRTLFPDGSFKFTDRDGREVVDGKAYYPAHLTLSIDRREALAVLRQIANYLGDGRDTGEALTLMFSGSIDRIED